MTDLNTLLSYNALAAPFMAMGATFFVGYIFKATHFPKSPAAVMQGGYLTFALTLVLQISIPFILYGQASPPQNLFFVGCLDATLFFFATGVGHAYATRASAEAP